ncbi:MAG: RyR domain-containing protein, partial [Pseudomonadales bacterium]|nr:RyR domain-containing protein [Pseudomonadales bacterium]
GTREAGLEAGLATRLYLTLQLFALEGDWTKDLAPLPWTLEVARFLAPVTTVTSLLFVFASQLRLAVANGLARFARDHVVTAGLTEDTLEFLVACARSGRRISVITEHVDPALVAQARRLGHLVIVVDRIGDEALRAVNVPLASHLVVLTGDDGDNVEVTLRAKKLAREALPRRSGPPLQIRLHLDDTRLAARLEEYPKFFEDYDAAETSFFNVYERSARLLFAEHAMEVYADALDASRVHLVLVGAGALQEQVLLYALRQAHFADGARPRVTLLGAGAQAALDAFAAAHPGATDVGEIDCIEMGEGDAALEETLPRAALASATAWIVCLDPMIRALRYTLALRRALLAGAGGNGPIFVAMHHGHRLARMLESQAGEPEVPDGIFPFAMLDEALSDHQILDERQDRLVRELHQAYLETAEASSTGQTPPPPGMREWAQLPEVFRRENRIPADHIEVKLRATDRELIETGPTRAFSAAEVELLGELESRRWVAAKRTAGWRYGEQRNDLQKVHDALLPWERLPEARREQNRSNIRSLLQILEEGTGRHARPCVFVGVTGHRPDRLRGEIDTIRAAIRRTFEAILALYPAHRLVVLSPLAEGADRLAARIALDHFDAELQVPLPLPYELYLQSFGIDAAAERGDPSGAEFRELLGRAHRYFEMPLRFGNFAALADPDAEALRARQYALCGAWIVSRSHELIGIWDGERAAGEGGTQQILCWREQGVPEAYRFANRFFPDRGRSAPWIVPATPAPDFAPRRGDACLPAPQEAPSSS